MSKCNRLQMFLKGLLLSTWHAIFILQNAQATSMESISFVLQVANTNSLSLISSELCLVDRIEIRKTQQ